MLNFGILKSLLKIDYLIQTFLAFLFFGFRIVQGKAFRKPDGVSEEKISAARAAAEKIAAAKQLGVKPSMEKDATSLTAEAVMKGQEAAPLQVTVGLNFRSHWNIIKKFISFRPPL